MTWRVPPYDRAVEEAEAFIRASWKVHGIIVSGSIVRGEGGPTSDLDIVVVHAEPWRVRDQRRFASVPAELFVNPPERLRSYFEAEHAAGRPCTANMLATGVVLEGAQPIVGELVSEARAWLAKPLVSTPAEIDARRYAAIDTLDDARDLVGVDDAMAELLLASAVQEIAQCEFWARGMFQPRRKELVRALARIDGVAAELVQRYTEASGIAVKRDIAAELAKHVLGVDTFFEWTSDRS